MIDNQLSRRNLDPFEASVLRGKKYLLEKKEPWRPKKGANMTPFPEKTYSKVAQETGVSPRTIARDAQLAQAVEDLKEIPKEILRQNKSLHNLLWPPGFTSEKSEQLEPERYMHPD